MRLRKEDVERIRKAFQLLDTNKDGFLDGVELQKFLVQTYPEIPSVELDALYEDLMMFADVDGDGRINVDEFLNTFAQGCDLFQSAVQRVAKKLTKAEVDRLKETFAVIDTNNDKELDEDELRQLLLTAFPDAPEDVREEYKDMILLCVDKNHDGKITLTEFIRSFALEQGVLPSEVAQIRAHRLAGKMTEDEVAQLKRTFQMIDLDHNGFIDPNELGQLLHATFRAPREIIEETKALIMAVADLNGDGLLDLGEFIRCFATLEGVQAQQVVDSRAKKLAKKLSKDDVEQLKATFAEIDRDHDGFIDSTELDALLAAAFPDIAPEMLLEARNTILAVADKNSDGRLNLTEFIRSFAQQQGVLPYELPEDAAERLHAIQRDGNEREAMNHEPGMREDAVALRDSGPTPQPVRDARNEEAQLDNATKRDVSGALVSENQLRAEFNKFDKDGNGYLSKDEFCKIYKAYDPFAADVAEDQVRAMLAQYRMLSDDVITYEEFAIIMLKLAQL
eukprot:NODE_810_length_1627_cov_220.578667_g800_i0.p1 GENE.NODE_810_length_1627_cov_220.578667_g800_i0~~NODE_810_length_1627_cov_220.578667_g800_i0.p1  ORF type:complete len:507 (-),score=136.86 NODE_810_length_1627_cov_220.578667_g800_i0:30-1550(-)